MIKLILGLLAFVLVGYTLLHFSLKFINTRKDKQISIMKGSLLILASVLIGGSLAFLFVSLF